MKTLLGASFTVSHVGPVSTHNETINVGDAGRGEERAFPVVFILNQFGSTQPSNIGGGASMNETVLDLSIETIDADDIDGPRLIDEIHAAIEALVRSSEQTLGGAYFSHVSAFRDFPPVVHEGGFHVYRRILSVRTLNLQKHS